jgi:rod shape-determining protein MreD
MTVNVRFALILIVGWIIQGTVAPLLAIGTAQPDLVLVLVCVFGILTGPTAGAAGGFVAGLLQDLLVPGAVGLGALVKTIMGYVSGKVDRTLLGDNILVPVLIIAIVSFVSQLSYMCLLFLVGEPIDWLPYLREIVAPSSVYTALIGFFVFPVLSKLLSVESPAETVFK